MLTSYSFQSYPATVVARFDCPKCGKKNRTRTFCAECTVNQFNRREDGEPRTAAEVRKQSVKCATEKRDQFTKAPLCPACEARLYYAERMALRRRRRGGARGRGRGG